MSSVLGIRKIFAEQHSVLATTGLGLVALGTIYIAKVGHASSDINKGTEAFRELCRAVGFSRSSVYGYSSRSKIVLEAMMRRFGSPRAGNRSVVWAKALDRPDEDLTEAIEFVTAAIQELFSVSTMMEFDARLSDQTEILDRPMPMTAEARGEWLATIRHELDLIKALPPEHEAVALETIRDMIEQRMAKLGH